MEHISQSIKTFTGNRKFKDAPSKETMFFCAKMSAVKEESMQSRKLLYAMRYMVHLLLKLDLRDAERLLSYRRFQQREGT